MQIEQIYEYGDSAILFDEIAAVTIGYSNDTLNKPEVLVVLKGVEEPIIFQLSTFDEVQHLRVTITAAWRNYQNQRAQLRERMRFDRQRSQPQQH
jgi:hypothetical protein